MPQELMLKERAREMRRVPTEPEKRLWRFLSNSQLGGFKFRRQAVIAPFIVDFLCPAKALVVEVDGDTHCAEADRLRDSRLFKRGFHAVRFTNQDVMSNMDGVLATILSTLISRPDRWPHPNPSPEGEGLTPSAAPNPSPSGEGFGVGLRRS